MDKPILMGAVLYNPKVSVIWDIMSAFFQDNGCPIDTVFYTNYELQVEALLKGHIDIAWNSPLAWLDAQRQSGGACRAIAMRDTDRERVSYLITKTQGRIKTLMVGKHGDHIGGELEAFRCLVGGEADASALVDLNWQTWTQDGTINPGEYTILATTEPFDHCCFTVRADFPPEREQQFLRVLYSMSYDNPKHREMMDLEGLKAWVPGRTSGYGLLHEAVEKQHFFAGTTT